jgi:hypothetical protein
VSWTNLIPVGDIQCYKHIENRKTLFKQIVQSESDVSFSRTSSFLPPFQVAFGLIFIFPSLILSQTPSFK